MQRRGGPEQPAWRLWERWVSEIVADLWSVSRVGIASTLGLIGVVSLPRAFVFHVNHDDPHPAPWVRVRLSCALGQALYPHPQWGRLAALWQSLYPLDSAPVATQRIVAQLEATTPAFVRLLLAHRPKTLGGRALGEVMRSADRQPDRLAAQFREWRSSPLRMRDNAPSLVFAAIGQARADGALGPEEESRLLADLLTYWALRSTLDIAEVCAAQPRPRARLAEPRPAARTPRPAPVPALATV